MLFFGINNCLLISRANANVQLQNSLSGNTSQFRYSMVQRRYLRGMWKGGS